MTIDILGIDIAKNVFQLHGVNRNGRTVLKRRVMRDQLLHVIRQMEPCTIVVEACTGAFTWARKFEESGHRVRIAAFSASSRNFDLNGEARTAKAKQSSPIISPV